MSSLNGLAAISYGINEYAKMFALGDNEFKMRLLNHHAGVDAFSAQMALKGVEVVNLDPLYQKPLPEIKQGIKRSQEKLLQDLQKHPEHYGDLQKIRSLLISENVDQFFQDFSQAKNQKQYFSDTLPHLHFKNEKFDLALSKFYLFTQSDLSLEAHLQIIQELARVANEIRIFPLVTQAGTLSPYVGQVIAHLQTLNFGTEIRVTGWALQKQGDTMLRIWAPSCSLAAHQSIEVKK